MGVVEILLAIVGISILVIIHEGGHYFAARAFGMRVLRYSIGFGPTIFRYQPAGSPTVFQLAAIPFLAYVQIAGMNPHEDVDPDDPEIYPNKGLFARLVTIAAGPVANYLTASALAFSIGVYGWPENVPTEPMTIASVQEGSPAAEAGLKPGDRVRSANGRAIKDVTQLIEVTSPRAGTPTRYVVDRDGTTLDPVEIVPRQVDGRGVIGVTAETKTVYAPMSIAESAQAAVVFPWAVTMAQFEGISKMIRRRTTEDLGGPVAMGKMVTQAAQKGPTEYFFMLMVLSVALGVFNLLPFPALDGGRIVFLGYELVTRNRPNEKLEAAVHTVGILFLLGVLVLVTFRDIWG